MPEKLPQTSLNDVFEQESERPPAPDRYGIDDPFMRPPEPESDGLMGRIRNRLGRKNDQVQSSPVLGEEAFPTGIATADDDLWGHDDHWGGSRLSGSTPPPAPPRPTATVGSVENIWGDSLLAGSETYQDTNPTLIEKILKHKKTAGFILGAAGVLSGLGIGTTKALERVQGESIEETGRNRPVAEQILEDTQAVEETEATNFAEQYLFDAEDLPDMLDKPFLQEGETAVDSKSPSVMENERLGRMPNADFLAAYESVTGLKFNIYTMSRTGPVEDEFEVNPESLEFLLASITDQLEHAPDNPAKDSMLQVLRDVKAGDRQRIINLAIDVTPGQDCLDPQGQLIRVAEGLCRAYGVALKTVVQGGLFGGPSLTPENEREEVPVIVAYDSGSSMMSEEDSSKSVITSGETATVYDVPQPEHEDTTNQLHATGHEVMHAVSDVPYDDGYDTSNHNTYKEGDSDHEITAHVFGEHSQDEFDMAGADKPSPELLKAMRELVESGKLKPIVQYKGADSSTSTQVEYTLDALQANERARNGE